MATSWMVHEWSFFYSVSLLINNITLIRKHWSNIIFFLLSSNEEDFVLSLDWGKLVWQNISISNWDFNCALSIKLMNEKRFLFFIVIVKSWFDACKDIIWFKTDDIVEEASEFINFTFYFNSWSCILLDKINVLTNFRFEFRVFTLKLWNKMLLL